jgi:tetratricopeptide (TPR) repeat protein
VDLYELTGRHDYAKALFERVVEFHSAHGGHGHAHAHPHVHGNVQLARFYADHDRNLDEALSEAKAAWAAFPNIQAADTMAWCLYRKGEFAEAGKMIRRALKHGTPDASIHFHAGMIYARLGNRQLARQHLYQALSLNPRFHPTQPQLAADTLKTLAALPLGSDLKS